MNFKRVNYRIAQFRKALYTRPTRKDLEQAEAILTPEQMALFNQLQRSEQVHSLVVLNRLLQDDLSNLGEGKRDLLVAALLHDVGKTKHPLRIWERVWIVLVKAFFPGLADQWGNSEPTGWKRAFVVAEQHAEWGAQLAAKAGASALTVELIRLHQNHHPRHFVNQSAGLLQRLQEADQES